ncbi:MAG: MFS transporter [Bacteroidota bacterium]
MKNEFQLLLILAVVQFCHIIDFMIIMPLGKTLMEVFDISAGQFSWTVSVYAGMAFLAGLVSTAFIDRFDRRSALMLLFAGFTVGTLACALAPNYVLFMIFRGLTGVFGGTLGALVLAIIGDVIPLERRSSAMGWVMTAFSVASVVGIPAAIWIAAEYTWQMPFFVVAGLSMGFWFLIPIYIPPLKDHLEDEQHTPRAITSPWQTYVNIFSDANQRAALLFTVILMLGHFTIIPFIAPYMQLNVGFADKEVSYIYAVGGALTVVLLPLFGRLADRYGRLLIFTLASGLALFSIFAITNLGPVGIPMALVVTSSFFVVASGRNVPATTMITSVVRPESRGSFMSIRQSFNELALFMSSAVAGFIVLEDEAGRLVNYEYVGYFAIFMSVVAVLVARRLKAIA